MGHACGCSPVCVSKEGQEGGRVCVWECYACVRACVCRSVCVCKGEREEG